MAWNIIIVVRDGSFSGLLALGNETPEYVIKSYIFARSVKRGFGKIDGHRTIESGNHFIYYQGD